MKVKVSLKTGLHARPASMLVKKAKEFKSDIFLVKDNIKADARSIMNLMGMALSYEDEVVIEAYGDDSEEAKKAIAFILEGEK